MGYGLVSEVVSEMFDSEAPEIKNSFYENFFIFLNLLYQIDVEENQDEFGSPDWHSVANAFEALM